MKYSSEHEVDGGLDGSMAAYCFTEKLGIK